MATAIAEPLSKLAGDEPNWHLLIDDYTCATGYLGDAAVKAQVAPSPHPVLRSRVVFTLPDKRFGQPHSLFDIARSKAAMMVRGVRTKYREVPEKPRNYRCFPAPQQVFVLGD